MSAKPAKILPDPNTPNSEPDIAQQSLTEALFSSIGDGVIATDEFGRVTRVNPAALNMLGYKEREMMGKWFPKVAVALTEEGSVVNLIDRPITKAFLTGKTITEKTIYQTKSGRALPVSITVSPILYDGRPVGAIETFRDITLEQEIDRMKSEFISLASHQLRTPLSAIKTYSHMLLEGYMGNLEPAQKESLNTIISATNRMNELISTLLNVTRIESGTIAIAPKNVRVSRLMEDIVREQTFQAAQRAISLHIKQPSETCIIKTDQMIVKEILSNLVTNAIKYTPNGGNIILALKTRKSDVVVSVTDTGVGIPRYSQDQIFTKFFRAQNVIKRETSGTGLGLYLVKGLVEALGGKVWFTSEENKGSTFFVALPYKPRPPQSGRRLA